MSTLDALEQRLTELEVRLTFIDDTVHALAVADAEQAMRMASRRHRITERCGTNSRH